MRRVLLLAFVFLAGCGESKRFVGDCEADSDCPVGSACRKGPTDISGTCVCRSDEACEDGSFCNAQGICQRKTGCRSNLDCADRAQFCDLVSGECLARTQCGFDVHCPPGTVCEENRCVNGCRDSADCPLRQVCDRTGQPAGALGACLSGLCDDDSFCDYGQECTGRRCGPASSADHCAPCGRSQPCSESSSFCLINSSYDPGRPENGGPNFCGVECTTNPEVCPNGYSCGAVVLLTQDQCTNDDQCGGGGRRCALGEGDLRGFCTCVEDTDCAFNEIPPSCQRSCSGLGVIPCERNSDCVSNRCVGACLNPAGRSCSSSADCQAAPLCSGGRCQTDGRRCQAAVDCLCGATGRCINTGRPCQQGSDCNPPCRNGGCYLGDACAPEEGLLCVDVRNP